MKISQLTPGGRDFDENPYSPDEERVAKWIVEKTGIGAGEDPIGFLMVSYEYIIEERNRLRSLFYKVEDLRTTLARVIADYKEQFGSGGPIQ